MKKISYWKEPGTVVKVVHEDGIEHSTFFTVALGFAMSYRKTTGQINWAEKWQPATFKEFSEMRKTVNQELKK